MNITSKKLKSKLAKTKKSTNKLVKPSALSANALKSKLSKKFTFKNRLVEAFSDDTNSTTTLNGAKTYKSTLSSTVDFFAMGAALRNRSEQDIISLFSKALSEDNLIGMKLLFHTRNIRGGQGERRTFRIILRWLADNHPTLVNKNLSNIVKFGRFDDLYSLFNTSLENNALASIQSQLESDIANYDENKSISLLAKWLPSVNTSSAETRKNGFKIANYLGLTPRNYRKLLSALREHINVTERLMCANKWTDISYEKVPSKAHLNYKGAFKKHDTAGYTSYLEKVKTGEKKINASTLFPYEIYERRYEGGNTLDALWNALPNYLEGNERNILVLADVSGSMSGRPMATSVSLAVYTAQRNKGAFNGYYMTYSGDALMQKIPEGNIVDIFNSVNQTNVGYSTDIVKAFRNLLEFAKKYNVPKSDMPEQVIVITDCEFNNPQHGNTNLEVIKAEYKKAGYTVPSLVFWNVNSVQNNVPAKANEKGVILISGSSPSIFKTLMSGKEVTPIDQMLETLNSEMYNSVVV